jgi:hypothetical protein
MTGEPKDPCESMGRTLRAMRLFPAAGISKVRAPTNAAEKQQPIVNSEKFMPTSSRHSIAGRFATIATASALLLSTTIVDCLNPALSAPLSPATSFATPSNDGDVIQVRDFHRGGAPGPHGGPAFHGRPPMRGPIARGPVGRPGGHWARPYRWPRGGAIAAGAAIGFVAAAAAAAYAVGTPPAPGMCWYYTDPSRTQGFWDYCQ